MDLTRKYHNLLEKTEGKKRQTYIWNGNVASCEENGRQRYYLQDELGSPVFWRAIFPIFIVMIP